MTRLRVLALLALVALAAASSAQAGPRTFKVRFTDRVKRTACPKHSPAGAECFLLRSQAHATGWGTVGTGPTLDVEAPQGSAACGQRIHYLQRLRFAHGTVTARVTGPRLCLGRLGTVQRRFSVVRGTGAFAAATGSGTVAIDVQSVGAIETWRGRLAG